MGTTSAELSARAILSAHNSDRDREHDALWEEFCERVELIAAEHRYEAIRITVDWWSR